MYESVALSAETILFPLGVFYSYDTSKLNVKTNSRRLYWKIV